MKGERILLKKTTVRSRRNKEHQILVGYSKCVLRPKGDAMGIFWLIFFLGTTPDTLRVNLESSVILMLEEEKDGPKKLDG